MKRVLVVSNVYPPHVIGGAEIVADRHVRGLSQMGFEIAVFAGRWQQDDDILGYTSLSIREDGIPIYSIVIPPPSDPSQNFWRPAEAKSFASVLAAHRPELVHFHNISGLGYQLIPLANSFGCRIVVTLHDYWGVCFKNTLLRNDNAICHNVEECNVCQASVHLRDGSSIPIRARRDYVAWCLSFADRLVSPSSFLLRQIERTRLVDSPIEHLSNGIETTKQSMPSAKPDVLQFACFSYLGHHKGILTLLHAAEELARDLTLRGRWRLLLAGHGYLAESIKEAIDEGRFLGAVEFVGRLSYDQAREVRARTHVVVLASEWPENEPVTLLEALQSGMAQIASRLGGNSDLVDEGRSGFMFNPGDSKHLARVMRRFIEEPDLAAQFGSYNRERLDKFSERRTLERLCSIYNNIEPRGRRVDSVVIVAGRSSCSEYSRRLELLMSRFHLIEDRPGAIRFLWHEWADAQAWDHPRVLWLWGEVDVRELGLLRRAHRAGVLVLIPSNSQLSAVSSDESNIMVYDTLLEALSIIAALQDNEIQTNKDDKCLTDRALATLSPDQSFEMSLRG